jgi:hypothetical protein
MRTWFRHLKGEIMDAKARLIARSAAFLQEVKNKTAGAELEHWLNDTYGPGSALYDELAALIKTGVEEGWAANVEIAGPRYRRSRLAEPSAATDYFSITAVYMDSMPDGHGDTAEVFRGDYHSHPYGELNMVIPLTPGAQLAGPLGWRGAGWTAPAPGSHHYPEARGGAVIALFYLPAGRIAYDVKPPAV